MKKKIFGVLFGLAAIIAMSVTAFAFDASYVEITNNVGKRDVIIVNGIEPKSVVSITAENGMLLGKKTVGGNAVYAKINLSLPSISNGNIVISVLEKGAATPKTITVPYDAEPVTTAPSGVVIVNNAEKKDNITVDGLDSRDAVIVYNAEVGGKKLASGRVRNGYDEVNLSHKQLGTAGGSIWVSVTSKGKHESPRVKFDFEAEVQSKTLTDDGNSDDIVITNNVGKKATIEVDNLQPNEIITIYAAETGTKKLGSAKCSRNKDEVKINIAQLSKEAGFIWMTIKRENELESSRFMVNYDAQPVTPSLNPENNPQFEIQNNPAGTTDSIYIDGLDVGDIVKIYANDTTSTVYLKGTVGSGKTDVTLTKAQFGVEGAEFYITNTHKNTLESERVKLIIPEEIKSKEIDKSNVTIINNAGIASTIFAESLDEGTTVTAYDSPEKGKKLGSATVASGATNVTISVGSLSVQEGTVWLTRKDSGLAESPRVSVKYAAKATSSWPNPIDEIIEIINNVGIDSTITVWGLDEGDIIKAYEGEKTGLIGQATQSAGDRSVTISTKKLNKSGGSIYLTITNKGKIESERTAVEYDGEIKSTDIVAANVTIENNANSDAVITINGLSQGDLITVYSEVTGSRTVCKGTAEANYIKLYTSGLKSTAGIVWITRQTSGLAESDRTEVRYEEQKSSTAIKASDITVENNAGISDVITVTGLEVGDTVKVYETAYDTAVIATGTANSDRTATMNVYQLGTGRGNIYISVTSIGASESTRTTVSYDAEKESDKISGVSFSNRTLNTVDVTISGLDFGDFVNVYDATGNASMCSTTAGGSDVTITLQLSGTSSGYVYITRTSIGKHESAKISYAYGAYVAPTATP